MHFYLSLADKTINSVSTILKCIGWLRKLVTSYGIHNVELPCEDVV